MKAITKTPKMKISNECGITIESIQVTPPGCPSGSNNGSVSIIASGNPRLEFSIDAGITYSDSSLFENLSPNFYEIIVRPKGDDNCALHYGKIELPAPVCQDQCQEINSTCGTILFPGDLTFSGFDNNIHYGTDRIVVSAIVDIKQYTSFIIANAIFEGGTPGGQRTNKWYASGDKPPAGIASHKITYIGSNIIPAGAIICFDLPSHNSGSGMLAQNFKVNGVFSSEFCVTDNGNTNVPRVNISTTEPDALFIMQGNWSFYEDFATFCGRVISGIQTGANWLKFTDPVPLPSRISRIHPHLRYFAIQSEVSPGNLACHFSPSGIPYTPLSYLEEVTKYELWNKIESPSGKLDLPIEACLYGFKVVEDPLKT